MTKLEAIGEDLVLNIGNLNLVGVTKRPQLTIKLNIKKQEVVQLLRSDFISSFKLDTEQLKKNYKIVIEEVEY